MSTPLAALCAGVVAILKARGERDLAELVSRVELELVGRDQQWRVNERDVAAQTFACYANPEDYVQLRWNPGVLDKLRDALGAAIESPGTQLADLKLVVRLPAIAQPWERIYRQAPRPTTSDPPTPEAVRATAAALLVAHRRSDLAEMLERAELERAIVPSSGDRLVKYVVRLEPEDLAKVQRDMLSSDAMRQAVTDAGTQAALAVATVELRARLVSEP